MTRHYPDLGSDASSVWNFYVRFSDVIWRGTSGSVAKCRQFSQATASLRQDIFRFTVHQRNFLLAMTTADEDWAAEVDEQERQISGEVSYCRCV